MVKVRAEKRINEFISLKLEGSMTNLYVNGKRFRQCFKLIFNLSPEDRENTLNFRSMDEIKDYHDKREEKHPVAYHPSDITAMELFQGHCSNIQVWVEHDYNTNLLEKNLAFPILRELAPLDPHAKARYRDEIISRLQADYIPVQGFLIREGFLSVFNYEELLQLAELISFKKMMHFHVANFNALLTLKRIKARSLSGFRPFLKKILNVKKFIPDLERNGTLKFSEKIYDRYESKKALEKDYISNYNHKFVMTLIQSIKKANEGMDDPLSDISLSLEQFVKMMTAIKELVHPEAFSPAIYDLHDLYWSELGEKTPKELLHLREKIKTLLVPRTSTRFDAYVIYRHQLDWKLKKKGNFIQSKKSDAILSNLCHLSFTFPRYFPVLIEELMDFKRFQNASLPDTLDKDDKPSIFSFPDLIRVISFGAMNVKMGFHSIDLIDSYVSHIREDPDTLQKNPKVLAWFKAIYPHLIQDLDDFRAKEAFDMTLTILDYEDLWKLSSFIESSNVRETIKFRFYEKLWRVLIRLDENNDLILKDLSSMPPFYRKMVISFAIKDLPIRSVLNHWDDFHIKDLPPLYREEFHERVLAKTLRSWSLRMSEFRKLISKCLTYVKNAYHHEHEAVDLLSKTFLKSNLKNLTVRQLRYIQYHDAFPQILANTHHEDVHVILREMIKDKNPEIEGQTTILDFL